MQELADFIDTERGAIVAEWEGFARTLAPAEHKLNTATLRAHADETLSAIARDMRTSQTVAQQVEKAHGHEAAGKLAAVGKVHATIRIEHGFTLIQIVAEYRALRASVLRLWRNKGNDPDGVTRFNEAIDEALTEAVARFTATTEHYRDQTLGILGHDLRNPLSTITTGCALLIASDDLSDKNARIAARMSNSANRMNRMIGDLLDLTRTRLGDRIPVVPAPVDLRLLCRQLIAELAELHATGALQFTSRGDLRGQWDSDRIAQVVSNLIRNAVQHGDPTSPIEVIAEDRGDSVSLAVHNHGPIIPPSAIATLFEPMFRNVQDDNNKNPGLGLGLYIASQVVASHGGKIDVVSNEQDGTTFTVRLPRVAAPA